MPTQYAQAPRKRRTIKQHSREFARPGRPLGASKYKGALASSIGNFASSLARQLPTKDLDSATENRRKSFAQDINNFLKDNMTEQDFARFGKSGINQAVSSLTAEEFRERAGYSEEEWPNDQFKKSLAAWKLRDNIVDESAFRLDAIKHSLANHDFTFKKNKDGSVTSVVSAEEAYGEYFDEKGALKKYYPENERLDATKAFDDTAAREFAKGEYYSDGPPITDADKIKYVRNSNLKATEKVKLIDSVNNRRISTRNRADRNRDLNDKAELRAFSVQVEEALGSTGRGIGPREQIEDAKRNASNIQAKRMEEAILGKGSNSQFQSFDFAMDTIPTFFTQERQKLFDLRAGANRHIYRSVFSDDTKDPTGSPIQAGRPSSPGTVYGAEVFRDMYDIQMKDPAFRDADPPTRLALTRRRLADFGLFTDPADPDFTGAFEKLGIHANQLGAAVFQRPEKHPLFKSRVMRAFKLMKGSGSLRLTERERDVIASLGAVGSDKGAKAAPTMWQNLSNSISNFFGGSDAGNNK